MNCFWYALTIQAYRNHQKYNEIRKGRPIMIKLAKELCNMCGCEWGKPVSVEEMPHFENVLNANIYVIDLNDIPLLCDTCNIYNIVLYKSEKEDAKQQFCFLYEENENGGHSHAKTNINGFMGADYFSSKCVSCFHHKKAFDKHECNKHADCKGCKTKQNKSATLGKEQAKYLRNKPLLGGSQELEDCIIKYTELHGCAPSDERIESKKIEIKRGH